MPVLLKHHLRSDGPACQLSIIFTMDQCAEINGSGPGLRRCINPTIHPHEVHIQFLGNSPEVSAPGSGSLCLRLQRQRQYIRYETASPCTSATLPRALCPNNSA